MPITPDEYAFMAAAGENPGSQWGTLDDEGRRHCCPMLCLLIARGLPLGIRDSSVYPELVEYRQDGEYGSPTFGRWCQELGVAPEEYPHMMRTEGVARMLQLWRQIVR